MIDIKDIPSFDFGKIKSELDDFGVYLKSGQAKLPIKYITGAKSVNNTLFIKQLTERDAVSNHDRFMANWDGSMVENIIIINGGALMAKMKGDKCLCDVYDWIYDNCID